MHIAHVCLYITNVPPNQYMLTIHKNPMSRHDPYAYDATRQRYREKLSTCVAAEVAQGDSDGETGDNDMCKEEGKGEREILN